MMSTLFRSAALAASLIATGAVSANTTHDAFVNVANSATFDGFNQLIAGRITAANLTAGLASNVADSDHAATLRRLSGAFYPASFGLYSFSTDSTFAFNVASAVEDLSAVTLQTFISVDTSQGVTGLLSAAYLPTLSYNGGTQALAAVYNVTSVSGGFGMDGTPLEADPNNPNYGYFTWDLSGITTPITSFSVNFGISVHSSALAFQLDQVTTPVPEPETYALMLAGMGVVGLVARRRKAQH